MSNWLDVADEDDIPPGKWIVFDNGEEDILIINMNGHYYAIQDMCSHDGAELNTGELEGDEIVCPRHGARFCVKSGEATCPPAYEAIETFKVRVADGKIQVCRTANS